MQWQRLHQYDDRTRRQETIAWPQPIAKSRLPRPRRFSAIGCSKSALPRGCSSASTWASGCCRIPTSAHDAATDRPGRAAAAVLRERSRSRSRSTARPRFPQRVIRGLGQLGMLGACLPQDVRRAGPLASRRIAACWKCSAATAAARPCSSTRIIRSARGRSCCSAPKSSSGSYLPKLASGEWISAFALTEPEAGSDAANVQIDRHADRRRQRLRAQRPEALDHQRRHRPGADGHGPHAGARRQAKRKITAFIVTPDMPGFRGRREADGKDGRPRHGHQPAGVSTTCSCPRENVLGQLGKGLQGRADGARLRPHDVRRKLHRRGEVLRRPGRRARQHARAVRPDARRVSSW